MYIQNVHLQYIHLQFRQGSGFNVEDVRRKRRVSVYFGGAANIPSENRPRIDRELVKQSHSSLTLMMSALSNMDTPVLASRRKGTCDKKFEIRRNPSTARMKSDQ